MVIEFYIAIAIGGLFGGATGFALGVSRGQREIIQGYKDMLTFGSPVGKVAPTVHQIPDEEVTVKQRISDQSTDKLAAAIAAEGHSPEKAQEEAERIMASFTPTSDQGGVWP